MNHRKQPTGGSTTIVELLRDSAALATCCIFRIPHTLVEDNETAYKPKIVSIGPYHHDDGKGDKAETADKARFQMIQQRKQRYLDMFLTMANEQYVGMEDLQNVVRESEQRIRDSYSEDLQLNQAELIDLMVLDGCFILMLFLFVSKKVKDYKTSADPIFTLRWILPTLRSDLLLLENQVPLFLLQKLLETSKLATDTSLNEMIFKFFGFSIQMSPEFWKKRMNLEGSHLLDLIRKAYLPEVSQKPKGERWKKLLSLFIKNKVQAETPTPSQAHLKPSTPPSRAFLKLVSSVRKLQLGRKKKFETLPRTTSSTTTTTQADSKPSPPRPFLKLVYSARKLQLGGIKFKLNKKSETPLDITLKSGVLEIPLLKFDDFLSSLLINCVAFMQFHMKGTIHMTSYVIFMGCLINTAEDATFLTEKGIIENYFGTGDQVSLFFKNTAKDIVFPISKSYLSNVLEGVNKYTSAGWHVLWAGFVYTHFNSSWTFLSSLAALMLLLLTIFQAVFAALAYYHPRN